MNRPPDESAVAGDAPYVRARLGRLVERFGVEGREWAGLSLIMLVAAAARFVNLPARGVWDTDQGVETGAIWNAVVTRELPVYGSPAFTTGGPFHHGALFYDLMMPFAWIGNGNPVVIVTAIALFGLIVVPIIWYVARSIGGTAAGLATALLAAVSPSLVDYSTFIWNPALTELAVAIACLGAWQAWTTRRPRWWVLAAAGTALTSQSHLSGLVLVLPMTVFFLLTVRRGPAGLRRGLWKWGLIGVGVFVLTWSPLLVSELTHNFPEIRGILSFQQPGPAAADPLTRLFVGGLRILAYPITYWPLRDLQSGVPLALSVATAVLAGMIWRVTGSLSPRRQKPIAEAVTMAPHADVTGPDPDPESATALRRERDGLIFVGGTLLVISLALSLGLKAISQILKTREEHYHAVADIFVIMCLGLVIGGLWRSKPLRGRAWSGHVLSALALASLVAVGLGHLPPYTSPDGGWPAAQAAAARIEAVAAGSDVGLVSLPFFRQSDAYGYPLKLDGVKVVSPDEAATVVLLCDADWYPGCGGAFEELWRLGAAYGATLKLVDRFEAAPQRILSVYRRSP
ncbi:MAG TPA: glycosyltransferase family 39 protein [Candidatus Limnocylindrales bacterium]